MEQSDFANLTGFGADLSADSLKHKCFSSIIEVEEPENISDSTLVGLARDALDVIHCEVPNPSKRPGVVTAMLSGDWIYLYSSAKGNNEKSHLNIHDSLFKGMDKYIAKIQL